MNSILKLNNCIQIRYELEYISKEVDENDSKLKEFK